MSPCFVEHTDCHLKDAAASPRFRKLEEVTIANSRYRKLCWATRIERRREPL